MVKKQIELTQEQIDVLSQLVHWDIRNNTHMIPDDRGEELNAIFVQLTGEENPQWVNEREQRRKFNGQVIARGINE